MPLTAKSPDRGFVFATTGADYTTLARRAARNLRAVMPDCIIDLFTDQSVEDEIFNEIHRLDHSWFRPKMQAIRESRFERTVILDADIVVLTDISELFDVLDQCDIAGTIGHNRSRKMMPPQLDVPRCIPTINTGVLCVRASENISAFAKSWEDAVREGDYEVDQAIFRKQLYESGLRFLPLGEEYNLIWLELLHVWGGQMGAPRVLHVRKLHNRDPGDPMEAFSLEEALGNKDARYIRKLLSADWSIEGNTGYTVMSRHNTERNRRREQRRKKGDGG